VKRLDILIYAHDGRGIGHISRSVAIGMACRRIYPQLRVLVISGARTTADLVNGAPLDWIKLPAYETQVINQVSHGRQGPSNFENRDLGVFRRTVLAQTVELYRPRAILVDHMPQGKQKELLDALDVTDQTDTRWVLGVRGLVGDVPGFWSDTAVASFSRHYSALLWYGDSAVLGRKPIHHLSARLGQEPFETGYVSRLSEFFPAFKPAPRSARPLGGVVSVPWTGEATADLLGELAKALKSMGRRFGPWYLYIGAGSSSPGYDRMRRLFDPLSFCTVKPAGPEYMESLLKAKIALIYGGYNSLTDVLYAGTPAVVLLRGMKDNEQERHLDQLGCSGQTALVGLPEKGTDSHSLLKMLEQQLLIEKTSTSQVNLSGAENTAQFLGRLLNQ
jgi:predicted glycosyltransferase